MSVNTLFVPNNDHIYCGALTIDGTNIPSSIVSGPWTPTLTIVSGIASSSLANQYSFYYQIGNIVTAVAKIQYTSAVGKGIFNMSLPIARDAGNFTNAAQVIGSCVTNDNVNVGGPLAGVCDAIVSSQNVQCNIAPDPSEPGTCLVNAIFTYSIV